MILTLVKYFTLNDQLTFTTKKLKKKLKFEKFQSSKFHFFQIVFVKLMLELVTRLVLTKNILFCPNLNFNFRSRAGSIVYNSFFVAKNSFFYENITFFTFIFNFQEYQRLYIIIMTTI